MNKKKKKTFVNSETDRISLFLVSSHSNTMDALADDLKNKATLTNGVVVESTKEVGTNAADKKSKTKAAAEGILDVPVGELLRGPFWKNPENTICIVLTFSLLYF